MTNLIFVYHSPTDAASQFLQKLISEPNKFQLKETKCIELQIGFSRSTNSFEAVTINNNSTGVVPSVKLLGHTISNNLKWNAHIENVKEPLGFISSSNLSVQKKFLRS